MTQFTQLTRKFRCDEKFSADWSHWWFAFSHTKTCTHSCTLHACVCFFFGNFVSISLQKIPIDGWMEKGVQWLLFDEVWLCHYHYHYSHDANEQCENGDCGFVAIAYTVSFKNWFRCVKYALAIKLIKLST